MKMGTSKIFGILFAFVMVLGMASAVTVTGIPSELSQSGGSFIITVSTNNLSDDISISVGNPFSGSGITFDVNESLFTLNDESKHVNISYQTDGFNFEFLEEYIITLNVSASNSTDFSKVIPFESTNFCEGISNPGKLEVDIKDITVVSGFGDDDEWFLFDKVEVELILENNGNEDIDDISLEWGLYDKSGNQWAIDIDEEDTFDLRDDDEETYILSFEIEEGDLDVDFEELSDGEYTLYVRATGTVDNTNNDLTCHFDSKNPTITIERDFVIAEDISINGELNKDDVYSVTCDSSINIEGKLYNIGEDDQEDLYLIVYNNDLEINERIDFLSIDSFKSGTFTTKFNVPKDAEEKTYLLQFRVYDEDNDLYETGNEESIKSVYLVVEGNCLITPPTVSAQLSAGEAKEGGQITIEVYLRNDDKKEQTFLIAPQNYASWATLSEVVPQTITLNSGESQNIYITLDLKSNSKGEQSFDLIVTSNNQIVVNSPVLVEVESGSFWSNFGSWDIDWQTWGIIALNVILLIAIIIVAVKILRKK